MIWSGHSFAHVPTAELLGNVQSCDLIGWVELKLEKLQKNALLTELG